MSRYIEVLIYKLRHTFYSYPLLFLFLVTIESAFYIEFGFNNQGEIGIFGFVAKIMVFVYLSFSECSAQASTYLIKIFIQSIVLVCIYIDVQVKELAGRIDVSEKTGIMKMPIYRRRIFGYVIYFSIFTVINVSIAVYFGIIYHYIFNKSAFMIVSGSVYYVLSILVSLGPFFWIASGIDPSPEAEKTSSFLRLQKVFWRLLAKIVCFHCILFVLGIPVFMPELVPWPEISLTYLSENTLVYFGIAWSQFLLVLAVIGTSVFVVEEYVSVTPSEAATNSE